MTPPIRMVSVPEDALDALKHCVENEKAHWSLSGETEACVDVPVKDLRAIVDALTAAPVREEGGAVEAAFKIATDLHHAYEQLIYGLPKYLEAENLTDEENMIREAWITLDVTAHRIAALATREEAPAEAGE